MNTFNDVAALLLERCEALGVGACTLTPEGRMTAATSHPRSLSPLLRTARALSALCESRAPTGDVVELFPGFALVLVPYTNTRGERGRLAAVAPSPNFSNHPDFAEVCRQASVDPRVVRADMRPHARFDEPARAVLQGVLRNTVEDVLALHERDESLGSFTRQLAESYDTIDLLYALGRSMHGPFNGEAFVGLVCERLLSTLSFRWVGAFFDSHASVAPPLRGLTLLRGLPPEPGAGLAHAALALLSSANEFPLVTSEVEALGTQEQPQIAAARVTCKGRACAVIIAGGKQGPDPFMSSYDTQLMEATAGFVSAFADNLSLYQDQHNLFMGTVGALTAAIDAKDPYTFGHSERVAWLSRQLALRAGFSTAEAERVHIAGLVHDVGKIGVPESVLCKAGKLTDEEFAHIKKHPEIGHRILRDIPGLADILPGVLHHHERFDGRGYPHGLRGEAIPHIARLIAVADTFDAMSSSRSYRAAMPRERVFAEIERSAGTQLDPGAARALVSLDLAGYDALFEKHVPQAALAA